MTAGLVVEGLKVSYGMVEALHGVELRLEGVEGGDLFFDTRAAVVLKSRIILVQSCQRAASRAKFENHLRKILVCKLTKTIRRTLSPQLPTHQASASDHSRNQLTIHLAPRKFSK